MNDTNQSPTNNISYSRIISSFPTLQMTPVENFHPKHSENFFQAMTHIRRLLSMMGDPLASHRRNESYYNAV